MTSTPRIPVAALRLACAATLLWPLLLAATAPELPVTLKGLAIAVFLASLVRPSAGLLAVLALAPLGLLLAPEPASASETLAWSFLAGWLAGVWRPLGVNPLPGQLRTAVGLYAACLAVSWVGLMLASSSGVLPSQLPGFLLRTISFDHLVFSSPEPESWSALHALTGVALLAASLTLARGESRLVGWIAMVIVATAAVIGLLTLGGVWRGWASQGYGGWFLRRFVTGTRYSLHLTDINAAGSLYVLGGLVAASLALSGIHRRFATLCGVLMMPALWLSGSRSAVVAALTAGAILLARPPRWPAAARLRPIVLIAAAGLVMAMLGSAVVNSRLSPDPTTGSATASLALRSEFNATSARMFASAPVFGVGIGRYYPRSPEFMSARLKSFYLYENAHNYLFQQFAELGLVGGVLFLALLATLITGTWRALTVGSNPASAALLTGAVAYLVTCLTGHPLLVPEAAFPFWIALGAAAAVSTAHPPASFNFAWLTRGVTVLLAASLIMAAARANGAFPSPPASPPDRGFHDERQTADGTKYRWSTRHAVAWVQPDVGFLTLDVQAPSLPGRQRPFVVRLEADGRVVQAAIVPPGRWTQIGVALPDRGAKPRRRIDLRVNQVWSERRDRPGPNITDDRPLGIMVGYPRLHPLAAVTPPSAR
ncbi:MAG: O-antigen ligase family protein [Vicinamibacterales bacterium]